MHVVHAAIVVTTRMSGDRLTLARAVAVELGLAVSEPVSGAWNGYASILVAPDGGKAGTEEADDYETRRLNFVGWMRGERDEDGGSPFEWVEVAYGSDDVHATGGAGPPRVVDHEWSDA